MPRIELELNPVQHITADAIGQPGDRVFYLQGWREGEAQPTTLIIEKIQLQTLDTGLKQMLGTVAQQHPERPVPTPEIDPDRMSIHPPVDPLFRAGEIGLGYDSERDLILMLVREILPEGGDEAEAGVVRFWFTRLQASNLAGWGEQVVQRGRPLCPQCGQPMEPEGHFCPKKNGHKH